MKQKLIDKLGLTFKSNLLAVLNSTCGIGKTTLLCFISGEFHNEGKRVLFLTNETSYAKIKEKVRGNLNKEKYNLLLPFWTVKYYNELNNELYNEIVNGDFEVIIFDDSYLIRSENFELVEKLKEHSIVIISNQEVKDLTGKKLVSSSLNKMQKADVFINLRRKNEFTFLEKTKYFFCFWLNKPNRTINLIKNRYGNQTSFEFYLDFKNNKIKW